MTCVSMRVTLLIVSLLVAIAIAGAQTRHWTETSNELLWRGRYNNCDHGYFVNLPRGVVGHGSLPPAPNHGILVSAGSPNATIVVTLKQGRVLDVYDSSDATELASPQAYLERYELKPADASDRITILERRDAKFRGFPAAYVHFRTSRASLVAEVEELVVYRAPKEIGPLFNVVLLRSTPEFYRRDHVFFVQIRNGLRFAPVPAGTCSND